MHSSYSFGTAGIWLEHFCFLLFPGLQVPWLDERPLPMRHPSLQTRLPRAEVRPWWTARAPRTERAGQRTPRWASPSARLPRSPLSDWRTHSRRARGDPARCVRRLPEQGGRGREHALWRRGRSGQQQQGQGTEGAIPAVWWTVVDPGSGTVPFARSGLQSWQQAATGSTQACKLPATQGPSWNPKASYITVQPQPAYMLSNWKLASPLQGRGSLLAVASHSH